MPTFRVISEADPGPGHREPRGVRLRRLVTLREADSLVEAAAAARDDEPHSGRRIISVEEMHPGIFVTDAELTRALSGPPPDDPLGEPLFDPERVHDDRDPLAEQLDFRDLVGEIVYALRESGLVPGLNLSVLDNELDEYYGMVEVFDEVRGIYLSRGTELRKMTDARDAVGWDGVLAVAREVIGLSNDLH